MKLPNKLYTYQESTLSKLPKILSIVVKKKDISLYELYVVVQSDFQDIAEFIEALTCLYALRKIDYDFELRRIHNAV
ncbi:hypothetical protein QWJ34_22630 [Saccharibacillus sp. CPCC 101409]|uniref:ABC-three component system middle component 7 n=1 Tax=Saccharibacillus sp. CPCC 101409 TaxID=3058041 RepID=UPI0026718257|nr:ABC-three component system middle component 7 [Saccharibacillus sp. CPCC 101409]MDO3412579.1 hypothetical protein [Saccharibacillus sp. CPCC 101409]